MTSTDIYLVVGGQEFRVTPHGLVSMDTNSEILRRLDGIDKRLDKIDSRLDGLESRVVSVEIEQKALRTDFTEFKAEVGTQFDALSTQLTILHHDQGMMSTFVYWVLGAIGIFLAALIIPSVIASVVSIFRSPAREADATPRRPLISIDDMKDLLALIRTDIHNNPAP